MLDIINTREMTCFFLLLYEKLKGAIREKRAILIDE